MTNESPLSPAPSPAEGRTPASNAAASGPSAQNLASLGDETSKDLVQLFKLLADETRLRVLYFLMQQDELNVRTLCKLLRQSQPAVSHHLALLRVAGIIECRRDGKHNFYHLVPKRCQAYLDTLFGGSGDQPRKVRVEDAVVTYVRDGKGG
ncbi:MAG: metalloregulator ArsR/SmtB family transcription factor [Planctomycetaceae bacterium]|nr:metalloregulator ArsR/SmtB family transcription factor [Planctomycetaceae bacterium]